MYIIFLNLVAHGYFNDPHRKLLVKNMIVSETTDLVCVYQMIAPSVRKQLRLQRCDRNCLGLVFFIVAVTFFRVQSPTFK